MKAWVKVLLICAGFLPLVGYATPPDLTEQQTTVVKQAVEGFFKKIKFEEGIDQVKPSALPGFVEVTSGSDIFYTSIDGQYLFYGQMFDLSKDKDDWNLTENHRRSTRASILDAIQLKDYVVFKPKEPRNRVVTIVTDIDCGYCRKLHNEIGQILDLGIEVRYVAFPRAGVGSNSYKKAVSVWCADDKSAMMTLAKQGQTVPEKLCQDNPVAEQFELVQELGIRGTPTLIFSSGLMYPGYLPAAELGKLFEELEESI